MLRGLNVCGLPLFAHELPRGSPLNSELGHFRQEVMHAAAHKYRLACYVA